MNSAVFDTNILIDCFNGHEPARQLLLACEDPIISVITWMEVMVGIKTKENERKANAVLNEMTRIELQSPIIEQAVSIRRTHGLKLWDAIIWATAQCVHAPLITRNHKDFPTKDPLIHIPYVI